MTLLSIIMLMFLIGSSIAVAIMRNVLAAIIIFMVYSLIMAVIWQQLNAPDVAITEAAVGAGVTTVLFMLTLKRIKE
ncbi:putative monovalent cation/H+ antiporter subunit B [Clostridium homopropionicum DSM 5847]|uniref:Putative monovalent cation/H+ antiporter subunit B n=1 Tax=Clostridium homopropionicum DSM 5847 TaxID=1121318 RepID=A0A0L6Z585_9CLOT|nr:hydrogenase subunit MbhD domain-containing protein [Clostridium homopropionicum]KOA18122.1 putative monovalent cation/H+ antiporter subunit B [Clostridium homopropionicum DSM 5847]SFG72544.1 Uncharacterized MnhB-related membrane protein [Clostridium homopropionicum]